MMTYDCLDIVMRAVQSYESCKEDEHSYREGDPFVVDTKEIVDEFWYMAYPENSEQKTWKKILAEHFEDVYSRIEDDYLTPQSLLNNPRPESSDCKDFVAKTDLMKATQNYKSNKSKYHSFRMGDYFFVDTKDIDEDDCYLAVPYHQPSSSPKRIARNYLQYDVDDDDGYPKIIPFPEDAHPAVGPSQSCPASGPTVPKIRTLLRRLFSEGDRRLPPEGEGYYEQCQKFTFDELLEYSRNKNMPKSVVKKFKENHTMLKRDLDLKEINSYMIQYGGFTLEEMNDILSRGTDPHINNAFLTKIEKKKLDAYYALMYALEITRPVCRHLIYKLNIHQRGDDWKYRV